LGNPISETTAVEKATADLNPLADLWTMIDDFERKKNNWNNELVVDLDPE